MENNITVDLVITGKVQGVWFRKYTKQKAVELSVMGYVENLQNGAVHVVASAAKDKIEALIQWCHQGSPLSKVDKVDCTYLENPPSFHSFTIKL